MNGKLAAGAHVRRAIEIPPVTPDEAAALEATELDHFLALAQRLEPDDWQRPIPDAPRNRDIRSVVAQIAGDYAAQASLSQFTRQANPLTLRFYHITGRSLVETLRQAQIGDRMYRTPAELIDELQAAGPKALKNRTLAFRPLAYFTRSGEWMPRGLSTPYGPFSSVRHLWFSRMTIAELATNLPSLDAEHDGRIIDLLLRSAAIPPDSNGGTVTITLDQFPDRTISYGVSDHIVATIALALPVFVRLTSRRRSPAWVREHAAIDGDIRAAMRLLERIATASEPRPY